MAVILGKRDQLHITGERFERPALQRSVFLNSVPKSGTHLIRNVMRMFVPEAQQWHREYIQIPNLKANLPAWRGATPYLSWGHMLFSDESVIGLQGVRHVVLVRDPYDWVLARARFYLSDEFQGSMNHIKNGAVSAEEILNMMIFGVHQKAPSLLDIYQFNAAAWLGTGAHLIRYEDLAAAVKDTGAKATERYIRELLDFSGIAMPADWRERVEAGADPKESRTARENLNITVDIPDKLPETQKRLVDFVAPGLRQVLGYA